MLKFRYLFVLSILFFWLAGSGCIGGDSNVEEAGIAPVISGTDENSAAEPGLNDAEIQEFEENISEIEDLLANSTLEEDIVVEEL